MTICIHAKNKNKSEGRKGLQNTGKQEELYHNVKTAQEAPGCQWLRVTRLTRK